MITIINCGSSNLTSVTTALDRVKCNWNIASTPSSVKSASSLILPGVGAFANGMDSLHKLNLVDSICDFAKSGKPILGICLGMQLLTEQSSEFGLSKGLGLIPANVIRLQDDIKLRVPNIGWCDTELLSSCPLFNGLKQWASFYYVHSYVVECKNKSTSVGSIQWGSERKTVAVQYQNLFGVQFHPERSQDAGLGVISNFMKFCDNAY